MKTVIGAGMLAIAIVAVAGNPASAERRLRANTGFWGYHDNRYCLKTMTGELDDCAYPTYQSCLASSSGIGGSCSINLRYVEREAPHRHRAKRRHH